MNACGFRLRATAISVLKQVITTSGKRGSENLDLNIICLEKDPVVFSG